MADHAFLPVRKVARAAGLPNFQHYCLHQLTINALDRTDLPTDTTKLAFGHGPFSDCMQKAYLSQRTTLDIQGIVMIEKEARSTTVGHDLCQLPFGSLNHTNHLPWG